MAQIDQRPGTYQSCCRLCLCDKVEALRSVFDDGDEENADAGNHGSLAQRIQACVSIEINSNDKFSTLVCTNCITKINNWQCYKDSCFENQHKLEDWLHNGIAPENHMIEQTIQIKEEPIDDISGENDMLRVKSELIEANITPMEIEPDIPPHLASSPIDDENKKCPICDKAFSSVSNKKKHMMNIHFNSSKSPIITSTSTVVEEKNEEQNQSNQNNRSKDQDNEEPKEQEEGQAVESVKEQEKIEFAAGLKLLQTNETPVAFEPLSKVELSYIDKCRAMVSMYTSLICACHKVQHPNLKGLLSHLRSINIWFPCFTCYRCMITFTDRSTYTRHYYKCKEARPEIETLIILSNLRKRSDIKTRLYQNFRCTICKYVFTFHEDICKHVNEEHVVGEAPYHCFCNKAFDSLDEYKKHIHYTCFVEYFCDMCQFVCKSVEEFLSHAAETHDKAEGFIMLQEDDFKPRKPVQHRDELKDSPPVFERSRRRSTFYEKSFSEDGSPTKEVEKSPASTPSSPGKRRRNRVPNPLSVRKSVPTKCLACPKIYSTYNNMMRHYRTHTSEELENGSSELDNDGMPNGGMFYSCPDCGGMYTEKDWIEHLGLKHEKKHQCPECNQVYHFKTELDQHRNSHLNLKVVRDSKTQSYKSEKAVLNCDICNLAFNNKEEMIEHNAQHGDMPILSPGEEDVPNSNKKPVFQCKVCNLTFSGYFLLCEHNREFHPEVRTAQPNFPKKCKYCDKILYTGGSYAVHKATHERASKIASPPKPIEKISKKRVPNDDDDESYHTCKKCFKVFSSRSNLRSHMRSHGIIMGPAQPKGGKRGSSSKRVLCEICHVSCENQEQLLQHRQEEHMDETEEMPFLENINGNDMIFTCDVCVATFSSKVALRRHKEKHQQEAMPELEESKAKVSCKYCKITFNSILALSKHMVQEHDEAKPKQLVTKTNKKQKQKTHVCSICKKQYPTVTALQAHIGWHKRGKDPSSPDKFLKTTKLPQVTIKMEEYQCDVCSTVMPNNTALQIHILEKHRNINLVPRCNICNLEFKTQHEYETHKSFHDLLERQQQQQRNKSPQKQNKAKQKLNNALGNIQLPPHITIKQEPKDKKFACSFCQAVFGKSENLTAHVRQAHKDKISAEYHCTQCDRIFENPALLNNHMKAHEKLLNKAANQSGSAQSKKFCCSICNMGFNLPKDLRLHTINAHPF